MIDIEKLMKLREAATPGPWEYTVMSQYKDQPSYIPFTLIRNGDDEEISGDCTPDDAAYICEACNSVPELVARIRELEAQVCAHSFKQVSALEPCRIVSNNNSTPPEWLMRRFTEVK